MLLRLQPLHRGVLLYAEMRLGFMSTIWVLNASLLPDPVGSTLSPWHDLPLYNEDGSVNFVCEIPKETSAKMEVATVSAPAPLPAPFLPPCCPLLPASAGPDAVGGARCRTSPRPPSSRT